MKTIANPEPSNDLAVEQLSQSLRNVQIGFCVGGGIAAIEAPRVARELRRKGAIVQFYATENAFRFVGREALEWASACPVVHSGSGFAEHIAREDLLLVLPATADLIGKAAMGICPDACSTLIQSALGMQKPIIFAPTMHDSLRESPAFKRNMEALHSFAGVEFINPRIEEGKWKSPTPERIALETAYRFNRWRKMKANESRDRILVTLGGTQVPLDTARALTNFSTGALGCRLVELLLEAGFDVVALSGARTMPLKECSGLQTVEAPTFAEFHSWLSNESNTHGMTALFHLAAVSDYSATTPVNGKISSASENLELSLKRNPKLIELKNIASIPFKAACKFTASNSDDDGKKARDLLTKMKLDAVFWNWGSKAFGDTADSQGLILRADNQTVQTQSKQKAAEELMEIFESWRKK